MGAVVIQVGLLLVSWAGLLAAAGFVYGLTKRHLERRAAPARSACKSCRFRRWGQTYDIKRGALGHQVDTGHGVDVWNL